ncbi:small membrane A-kinase anchor protein [Apodemus sylvaticus]|uniref:small membrane A-kinase anchor protein n=1 Tax=Apodemus sylvaticus TaxID=10129 RepID=UPI00224398D6|nr:small membrane A-kinase anchor protein [Apodemus sylvaticus]
MGCMKSKETFPFPTTLDIDKLHESEEAFMPDASCQYRTPSPDEQQHVQEVKKVSEPSALIGAVILEFADRLANEIVEDALQQWACENIQYYNIPYIESEGSDVTID